MKINHYFKEAQEADKETFIKYAQNVLKILKKEEKIVYLPKRGGLTVIGDLHGNPLGIKIALQNKVSDKSLFLFLGDYGDRGNLSPEVHFILLKLKLSFPQIVILLRGNHEPPSHLIPHPHDLPLQLEKKYKSREPYLILKEIWEELPIAAVIKRKYLFLHGGLPYKLKSIEELTKRGNLEEILWSDPSENNRDVFLSPRGAGRLFGPNITKGILGKLKIKTMIRSHEMCEGVRVCHEKRILTLFSTNVPPYRNKKRAILKMTLDEPALDAFSLLRKAVFF